MGVDLDRKVVAVVGAGGALGSRVCARLRRRGAVVVAVGPHAERLPEADGRVVADIRDPRAAEAVLGGAAEHGGLDGLVIASGVVAFGDLAATDPAVSEELFLVNTLGPLWLIGGVADALSERRGFVAAVTGVVAEAPLPGMVPYAASKAALSSSLTALRRELRRRGVSVCDLRPPHTETGLAGRAIAGTAPKLPAGLDPDRVADRIVSAIEAEEHEVPSASF